MTNTQSCKLVVHGAAGRMGQRIVACALAESEQWDLVAAIDRTGHPRLGDCLLYTSPSPRDLSTSRMPSSA